MSFALCGTRITCTQQYRNNIPAIYLSIKRERTQQRMMLAQLQTILHVDLHE
jgi:hypothetical protein